jgi:UDP-N-acetylglucosamine transferase subunit ALG13
MFSDGRRGGSRSTRIFVTVGTDHHPFDRLIRWIDEWLATGSRDSVDCLVQAGTSSSARRARSTSYVTYPEMDLALREASAVVCHGGPGTIMLALAAGKKPIVVPRRSALGEHVDDHQVVFARRVSQEGSILLAESQDRFRELLDWTIVHPERFRSDRRELEGEPAVEQVQQLVDELVSRSALPCP